VTVPIEAINEKAKVNSSFKVIQKAADHYNVFKDLFDNCYFTPFVDLKVKYGADEDKSSASVHYGNKIATQIVRNPVFLIIKN
jgi:hypothetical protein